MGVYRSRLYGVGAKIEGTSGVWAAPAFATDAVRLSAEPTFAWASLESGELDGQQSGGLGPGPRGISVGSILTGDVGMVMAGKRNAAGKPQHSVFLRGLGLSETIDATPGTEKVTYRDLDTGHETFSMLVLTDEAELVQVVGCVCSRMVRRWQAGGVGILTFSVRGYVNYVHGANPTEGSLAGLVLPVTASAPPWKNNTVLLGVPGAPDWGPASAQPLHARNAELTVENTIADRHSAGATDVFTGGPVITDKRVTLTMDVERVSLPTFSPFDVARSDGFGAGAGVVHDTRPQIKQGTVQYARETFNGGYWEMGYPGKPKFEGLAGYGLTGRINNHNGPSGRWIELIYD